jgi:hypothetical protein
VPAHVDAFSTLRVRFAASAGELAKSPANAMTSVRLSNLEFDAIPAFEPFGRYFIMHL